MQFDATNFGLYNVTRRYITILSYPLLMGLGISIPIFIAKLYHSKHSQASIVTTALFLWFSITAILFLFNVFFPGKIIFWVLGKGFEKLSWPVLLGFSCLYLYTILYGTYRGEQRFINANFFQIISAGIVPLLAIFFSSGIVYRYLLLTALLMFISNTFVLIDLYQRKLLTKIGWDDIKNTGKQFAKFGLPRVPGELALFGLMSCPHFFIARYDSLKIAGYIALGFTLVQLVASFFEFIGTLMLPKSAELISDQQYYKLKQVVKKLILFSFIAATLISFVIFFKLKFILNLLDKDKFIDNIENTKMIITCIPFYIVYLIIRNPQDALSIKPFNTYNLLFCFIIQLLLLFISIISDQSSKVLLYHLSIIIPFILLGIISFISWNFQINKHLA